MSTILITPAAENDLIDIWIYIARDSYAAADKVHQSAHQTFNTLAAMPEMGTRYRSKRKQLNCLRFFPINKYPSFVVYYRQIEGGIEIVRVLHAHMKKDRRLIGFKK